MFKVIIGCAVIFSFVCMLLAAAPFTPAISGSFIMLLFAGTKWGQILTSDIKLMRQPYKLLFK